MTPTLIAIGIAPKKDAPTEEVARATLLPGQGIEGDRRCRPGQKREQELTLISAEAIDAFNAQNGTHIPYIAFRRNLVTRGIDLNTLVGRRFRVGGVECFGLELCEPCSKLARLVDRRVLPDLVHRGGLRAAILGHGSVVPGDPLQVL